MKLTIHEAKSEDARSIVRLICKLAEKSSISCRAVAQRLPDLPRWVEVRDILYGEDCEVFGFQEGTELSFALPEIETASVFVVGKPSADAIEAAIRSHAKTTDVIAPWENATWLAPLLPGWSCKRIIVHVLPDLQRLPAPSSEVRFLEPHTIRELSVPEELLRELQAGAQHSPIAATFVGNQPVSFCYAGARTESLWDVAIDTLPEYQRKGYAARCAAYMIRYMQTLGRTPVWQALEDNPASWQLAEKLGFMHVDELALFEQDST